MSYLDNIMLADNTAGDFITGKTEEEILLEYCEYIQLEEQMRQAIDQYEQDQLNNFDFPGNNL